MRLEPELARVEDEDGRALYDLPDAPRPDPETPAAPRRSPPSTASCSPTQRSAAARILPDEHRDAVYERRNLQIRPSYLVDGLVAGMWSIEVSASRRPEPCARSSASRARRGRQLLDEAEGLARALHPQAKGHAVSVER